MDELVVQFQVSLILEGLLTLSTLPLLLVSESVSLFNVSLHVSQSFELFCAMGARVQLGIECTVQPQYIGIECTSSIC